MEFGFLAGLALGSLLVIPTMYFRLKNIQTTGKTHNREFIMGKLYYVLDADSWEIKIDTSGKHEGYHYYAKKGSD